MHVEQHLALEKIEQKSRKKSRFQFFRFLVKIQIFDFKFGNRPSLKTTEEHLIVCIAKSEA